MFYAADHYYDVSFCNDFATLYRFVTKAERDAFVEDRNFIEAGKGNIKTESVTRDEARRHFSKAFVITDQHLENDMRDWTVRDGIEQWSASCI